MCVCACVCRRSQSLYTRARTHTLTTVSFSRPLALSPLALARALSGLAGGAVANKGGDGTGVLLVYHIVCPHMDVRDKAEQVRFLYTMMCAQLHGVYHRVCPCAGGFMHAYVHTHYISQYKRTTPKTHTCCPPPNLLPPYRAPSLSLIPSLCLLSLSEARAEGGKAGGREAGRERERERESLH